MADSHTAHGYWLEEAGPAEPLPPLEGAIEAGTVVVGGGYTGMWTAWWLLEADPDARVVVLEAAGCAEGPSGRNGGFVNSMSYHLDGMSERFGAPGAVDISHAAAEAVRGVGEWCDANGVDAWYRHAGYLLASTAPAHDGMWDNTARAWAARGKPEMCQVLSAAELRAHCDSPLFRGGLFFPDAATVQPARLARGLRHRLVERGAAVHEGSRVTGLDASGPGVVVRTARGRVSAGRAVLAVGGAATGIAPLRRKLTVTSSHVVITEPVPDVLEEIGWTGGECMTDSRAMVHYFRTTPDGRIAFGWGGGRVVYGSRLDGRAELDPGVVSTIERQLVRFFPQLAGRRIEHAWGGPIDVSPSHLPLIGSLHGGRVHYAFGYTGNGVGPSHYVSRALASLALGRRDRWTALPLVEHRAARVPPEPLRYVGGAIVRRSVLRREAAEERGERADPLTRAVAGLPERLGIHIGR
jgi:glycine/D-amino acid oxidase-like deaminating enzyme